MRSRRALAAVFLLLLPGAVALSGRAAEPAVQMRVTAGGPVVVAPLALEALPPDVEDLDVDIEWIDTTPPAGLEVDLALRTGERSFEPVTTVPRRLGGSRLFLHVAAGPCCPSDAVDGRVVFRNGGAEVAVAPFRIALHAAPWRCHGAWLLPLLGGLLAFLLTGTAVNVRLLPAVDVLTDRLVPVRYDGEHYHWEEDPPRREELRLFLLETLRPHRRLLSWLRANPLRFCLPGRRYRETLCIYPTSLGGRLETRPPSGPDLEREEHPPQGAVYLVATDEGRVETKVVATAKGRVERFGLHGPWSRREREGVEILVPHHRDDRLVDRPGDGGAKGWEFR